MARRRSRAQQGHIARLNARRAGEEPAPPPAAPVPAPAPAYMEGGRTAPARRARIEQSLEKICLRCAQHLDTDGLQCDGNFDGIMAAKCGRCRTARHACEPLAHRQLIAVFNGAVRAKRALDEAEEEDEDDRAAFDIANNALKTALRRFHINKNKMSGEERTPRKARAGAAGAGMLLGAGGLSAETGQDIARSLRALVEVGRVLVLSAGGDTANVDAIMAGGAPQDAVEEEDEEMGEGGDKE